ncbi:MAG: thymidylate synthase [Acidobacteria bacterium]|nr:thymidylate synthase [Acidobacteriota bacterium]NIM63165.1 thymidylate synthase [Acidobacteriota bacterium]NIQ85020.1 thymidylate synthase [Acidobacteriota bacterium]NIT10834.1 thymidylate synthase [Acidobacteriota bacterium]
MERFTAEERAALEPYFTNLDRPVFALINLPEVVKGALFARYSRSAKSLRRLFLDEFYDPDQRGSATAATGSERAEKLYEKVFFEYGDDSVAQLGGVHLACENVSNILTKLLEWGRLMAYLEQSTRYVPYTGKIDDKFKYHVPAELDGTPLRERYVEVLDDAFDTYCKWLDPLVEMFMAQYPREEGVSKGVYKRTIRAKALDALRGLLPAATQANVGIYGTGQAYEALLLRMRANPLAEARQVADEMLVELRKVIPAFLRRVDLPDRGDLWSRYLAETREATAAVAAKVTAGVEAQPVEEVTLSAFDPDGETRVVAAALYASTRLPDDQLQEIARGLSQEQREEVLKTYVGERANRRHKPGRAFERTSYRFDILGDYGAFRDLQRHRLLTLEWQPLSPHHGYLMADSVAELGAADDWKRVMERSAELYEEIEKAGLTGVGSYAIPMAYRVRFYMDMNAREAMHVIELRTAPAGHPSYRRVCQSMHRLIAEQAGHQAIAAAMSYVDHSEVELERLEAEKAAEKRRAEG